MKSPFAKAGCLSLILLLAAMFTTPASAQQGVVFPVAPDKIMTREDGSIVEVYSATVQSVRGNRLTVRFPHGVRHTYDVPSDFRFQVNGRSVPTRSLNRGDQLTAYVTRHPVRGHSLVQVEETAGEEPVYGAEVQPEAMADELPATASKLPLTGLLGVLLLAVGALGFGIRRRLS